MAFGATSAGSSDRLFAWDDSVPLHHRPADAVRFVLALLVFVALSWAATPAPRIDVRGEAFLSGGPGWIEFLAWGGYTGSALVAVGLVAVSIAGGKRSRGILRDLVAALVVGTLLGLIAVGVASKSFPAVLPEFLSAPKPPGYPSLRAALTVSVFLAAAPYLTEPMRRAGRWLSGAALVTPVLLGFASLTGSLAGASLALLSVAAVRAVLGSPEGRPSLTHLKEGLNALGVDITEVRYLPEASDAVGHALGTRGDNTAVTIKVFGRDSADRARSVRMWRSLWYRTAGVPPRASALQQVEHEALMAIAADRVGVRAPSVVAAGLDDLDNVVLVLREPPGVPLGDPGMGEPSRAALVSAWESLERLHQRRFSHGDLSPQSVLIDGDRAAFTNFGNASATPSSTNYGADIAALLGTTAMTVGPERAVEAAVAASDPARLEAALPYLQNSVVAPDLRRQMKQSDVDFDHLRTGLAESISVQAPPLEPLKRIRPASLLLVVGTAVAANSLISQVADIGLSTVSEQLKSATLSILAVTFALKVVGYALPVIGLRAATRQPLPGAPVAIFQSAKSFVGLVGSGPLGTVALAVRFFQRLGVSAATALTAQSITRAVGFVAEVMLLLLTSRTVRTSFDSNDGGGSGNRRLVILVVAAIVVGTVVLLVAPKIRASILRSVREAMVDLRAVATSPVRLGQIAAGELAQRLLSAMALATTAAAFGVSVPFGALVFASVATGLVAGISAVPAGVGVAEGAMTSLLSAVGVAPEQAFAIAITHRVVTSYLPPLLGFFSVRWLQRAGYL